VLRRRGVRDRLNSGFVLCGRQQQGLGVSAATLDSRTSRAGDGFSQSHALRRRRPRPVLIAMVHGADVCFLRTLYNKKSFVPRASRLQSAWLSRAGERTVSDIAVEKSRAAVVRTSPK
jgi:hypothetical protein